MTGMVAILDDDAALRDALAFQLGANGVPTRSFATAEALLAGGLRGDETCLLADVRLGGGMDGLTLLEHLRRCGSRVPVVVMTGHADVPMAVRAMREGALNFLEKPFPPERLLGVVAEARARGAAGQAPPPAQAVARSLLARLSPREAEVLAALARGAPSKVVAHWLGLSPRTVEGHRAAVMQKLGLRSFAELVRLAVQVGLTDPAPGADGRGEPPPSGPRQTGHGIAGADSRHWPA
jgi:two-component system response regulator FixJ